MDWFLYDRDLRHERVNIKNKTKQKQRTLSMMKFFSALRNKS